MTQFSELEDWSRQIKERSSEENVVNVALDQIETDQWIKQYGDVLFKVIVAQSKYIKLLERRIGEQITKFLKHVVSCQLFVNKALNSSTKNLSFLSLLNLMIWNRFVETNKPEAKKPSRSEIIQQRHQMGQYMIGVSELDVEGSNLQETSGVYKINHADIGVLYDEITGFVTR